MCVWNKYWLCLTICCLCFISVLLPMAADADVKFFDMRSFYIYDVTNFIRERTGIYDVQNLTGCNMSPGEGDEMLLAAGEGRIVGLDALTFSRIFELNESDVRALFGLPEGTGYFSVFTKDSETVDELLYYDRQTEVYWSIHPETGRIGPYTGVTLPGDFCTGFSEASEDDIAFLYRMGESGDYAWRFRSLTDSSELDLDMQPLFGMNPAFVTEVELSAAGQTYRFLAASNSAQQGTQTPTPTPSPTTTPDSTSYPFAAVVANGLSETLSVLDCSVPRNMETHIADTGNAPNQLLVNNGVLYCINSRSNSITLYELPSLRMLTDREISVEDGRNPFKAAFLNDSICYVTNFAADSVSVVNVDGGFVQNEIALPHGDELPRDPGVSQTWAKPCGICIVNDRAYVACTNLNNEFIAGGPGIVCVIDVASQSVIDIIETNGRDTVDVSWNEIYPDSLWITSAGDYVPGTGFIGNGNVDVYSLSGNEIIHTVELNEAPFEMIISPAGRAYVGNGRQSRLLRFNVEGYEILPPIDIPGGGIDVGFISGLSIAPDGLLWITEFSSDSIYILDTNQNDALIEGPYIPGLGPDAVVTFNCSAGQ